MTLTVRVNTGSTLCAGRAGRSSARPGKRVGRPPHGHGRCLPSWCRPRRPRRPCSLPILGGRLSEECRLPPYSRATSAPRRAGPVLACPGGRGGDPPRDRARAGDSIAAHSSATSQSRQGPDSSVAGEAPGTRPHRGQRGAPTAFKHGRRQLLAYATWPPSPSSGPAVAGGGEDSHRPRGDSVPGRPQCARISASSSP